MVLPGPVSRSSMVTTSSFIDKNIECTFNPYNRDIFRNVLDIIPDIFNRS